MQYTHVLRRRTLAAIAMVAWTLLGAALLRGLGVLTPARFFFVAFVGFLLVAAFALPERPSRRLRVSVLAAVLVGLIASGFFVVERITSILG